VHPDKFVKEVRFMTALNHPHIVKLFGVCTTQDTEMFIITELLEHGDLRHFLLNERDNIHVPELMSFAVQVRVVNDWSMSPKKLSVLFFE